MKAKRKPRSNLVASDGGLGPVTTTARGFEIIEFKDYYNSPCSLQMSSVAIYEKPGTSCLWLGCMEYQEHPVTKEELSPRMHLDRKQVKALIGHLQRWLNAGTFNGGGKKIEDKT